MWPGFDSRTRSHTWGELVVDCCPCSKGFSPGSSLFLPPQKSTLLNFNSISKQWMKSHFLEIPLQIPIYFFFLFYTFTFSWLTAWLSSAFVFANFFFLECYSEPVVLRRRWWNAGQFEFVELTYNNKYKKTRQSDEHIPPGTWLQNLQNLNYKLCIDFPSWSYVSCNEHLRKNFLIWIKSDFVMNV